jgi:5-methylcytosine-specific restriction endonuclease McrA
LSGECEECGQAFIRPDKGTLRPQFCSVECSKRHGKRIARVARKALERAKRTEPVNPFKVFERDGWRCKACNCRTPKRRRGTFEANAPELDHIIPLSKGGEHSYRNTQLLCRACNLAKGDAERGQLRLFG